MLSPSENNFSSGEFDQSDHRPPERRLALAALAHQADGFAGRDAEANVVHRSHKFLGASDEAGPNRKMNLKRRTSRRLMRT